MDISRAKTEAAVAYKGCQDALDKHVRVAAVAHALLDRVVAGPNGDHLLGALYGLTLSRAKPAVRVPNSADAVRLSAHRSVAMSIAAVQSDFEWACRNLLTDVLEFWQPLWAPKLGEVHAPQAAIAHLGKRGWSGTVSEVLRTQSAESGFVVACYSLLGMKAEKKALAFLPLFEFFRRCRNRIVHQDGTAGRDLEEFAKQRDLKDAYDGLSMSARKMAPALPEAVANEPIDLRPEHAILFIIVARSLFDGLAEQIRSRLDEDGYLRMAAHYGYGLAHHPFRAKSEKDVVLQARRFLRQRYHVQGTSRQQLIADFKRLNLWDAMVDRFHGR